MKDCQLSVLFASYRRVWHFPDLRNEMKAKHICASLESSTWEAEDGESCATWAAYYKTLLQRRK